MAGAAVMLLSACNGIFSDIYDDVEASTTEEFGFMEPASETATGKIYIDATDYTCWTYINFHDMSIVLSSVYDSAPENWDIAIHRYDAKTNGGAVAETDIKDLSLLKGAAVGDYVGDIWTTEKIVTDMSTMMDGYLSYVESDYNAVLSEWLDVDTSTMPPIYTLSEKVYMVRLKDATKAAVKLVNFMDASGVKGFMTIEYKYPVN